MRLHFVVEGQTEETFVRDILAAEMGSQNVHCDVHRITTGRRRGRDFRGGLVNFEHLRKDLELWIKQDDAQDSWFTTMIDLYGLPLGFPGIEEARKEKDPLKRVALLESKLKAEIAYRRFIPYIQLHEFESLLFSAPDAFSAAFPDIGGALAELHTIRDRAGNPELINDGPETHPSKRICRIVPEYTKASAGPLIAKRIGLPVLRRECQHFAEWISIILKESEE